MRAVPDAKNAAQFCHDFVNGSHVRGRRALPFVIAVDVGAVNVDVVSVGVVSVGVVDADTASRSSSARE
jgi:hypothetical protein